jgi:hypothetical protein
MKLKYKNGRFIFIHISDILVALYTLNEIIYHFLEQIFLKEILIRDQIRENASIRE